MRYWQAFLSWLFPNRRSKATAPTPPATLSPLESDLVRNVPTWEELDLIADQLIKRLPEYAAERHTDPGITTTRLTAATSPQADLDREALSRLAEGLSLDLGEQHFTIDDTHLVNMSAEAGEVTYISPEQAYRETREELHRRGMGMLVISQERFMCEWQSSSPSSFTQVVAAVVNSVLPERSPTSPVIISGPNRRYRVHIHRGVIRAITLVRE